MKKAEGKQISLCLDPLFIMMCAKTQDMRVSSKEQTWTLMSLRLYFETTVKHVIYPNDPLGKSKSSISVYTVQTMGLLMVWEREREIEIFIPLCCVNWSCQVQVAVVAWGALSVTQESNRISLDLSDREGRFWRYMDLKSYWREPSVAHLKNTWTIEWDLVVLPKSMCVFYTQLELTQEYVASFLLLIISKAIQSTVEWAVIYRNATHNGNNYFKCFSPTKAFEWYAWHFSTLLNHVLYQSQIRRRDIEMQLLLFCLASWKNIHRHKNQYSLVGGIKWIPPHSGNLSPLTFNAK